MPTINATSMLVGDSVAVAAYYRGADVAPLLLPNRVRAILNKYDATMLLPGVAEPILGPELVVNGGLDSAAGWSLSGTATVSGGVCDIHVGGTGWLEQGVATKAATMYRVAATVSVGATFCGAWDSSGRSALLSNSAAGRQPGQIEFFFTANDTLSYIAFTSTGGAATRLDNISVREILGYQNTYSSFIAGNYKESTGQTLAAADQQVGLVVDAARVPGLNITPNNLQGFTVVFGGGALLSNTSFSSVSAGGVQRSLLTVGRIYEIVGSFSQLNPVEFSINNASGTKSNTVFQSNGLTGTIRAVFTAIVPEMYFRLAGTSTVTCEFSVRELPGIHASQSTSGFQPVLRNTAGIQSWQFDGTDDRLSLSAVPFQTQDVSFAITAFTPSVSDAAARRLWDFGGNGAEIYLTFANGNMQFASYGGSGSSASIIAAGAIVANTPYIASCVNTGASRVLRIDGVERGSTASAVANSTANVATIGNRASGDRAFSGFKHLQIFGKGSTPPTEAELLTLERWAASIQGRTL